jgi:SAM-dependent methyltransferase
MFKQFALPTLHSPSCVSLHDLTNVRCGAVFNKLRLMLSYLLCFSTKAIGQCHTSPGQPRTMPQFVRSLAEDQQKACRVSSLGLSLGSNVRALDLGSGKGAAARHLARTFGCHVTCFNLGENQNSYNLAEAAASGLQGLITCVRGNFNSGLPAAWTASFDLVWSQEALCHAKDQRKVLQEVMRVLKPGGAAIFTDIMRQVRAVAPRLPRCPTSSLSLW